MTGARRSFDRANISALKVLEKVRTRRPFSTTARASSAAPPSDAFTVNTSLTKALQAPGTVSGLSGPEATGAAAGAGTGAGAADGRDSEAAAGRAGAGEYDVGAGRA